MSQCCDASLGCRVALRLGLAHAIARRRDVHDSSSFSEMWGKKLDKVERGSDTYAHGILELLIAARIDTFHQRQGIVDEIVHMAVFRYDLLGKLFQSLLVGNVAHKVVALLLIYDTDLHSSLSKLLRNAAAYALSTSRHDGYFILEILHIYCHFACVINWRMSLSLMA